MRDRLNQFEPIPPAACDNDLLPTATVPGFYPRPVSTR